MNYDDSRRTRNARGGQTLKTGKIGRVNCVRQQLMMPGENIRSRIKGKVKLEALRERDTLRINAHLGVFLTPLRWLSSNWPTILQEGPDTAETLPTITTNNFAAYGVGSASTITPIDFPRFWQDSCLRVYNEWYKWPEDADATTWSSDGNVAVPLSHTWSRLRDQVTPDDTSDYEVASATEFDVRDLAEVQGRFRSAMKRDVLSYNRYMELVKEAWGADGSREVDQVPMLIDSVEVGVNPREIPATDGASLGQWQSYFDFEVDHMVDGITAPEHCVLTYMLLVRFPPIIEGVHPMTVTDNDWQTLVGDTDILAQTAPVSVRRKDVTLTSSTTALGSLPAGWQWRSGHDVIGSRVDLRDSFPYMLEPTTTAQCRDATRIQDAFRSQSLGDYVIDLYVSEDSKSRLNSSMESYYSGMTGSRSDAEFPKGGKQL